MKKFAKIAVAGFVGLGSSVLVHAESAADAIVTQAQGVTGTATTTYVGGAGLGVAILTVSMIIYALRRGVKTR